MDLMDELLQELLPEEEEPDGEPSAIARARARMDLEETTQFRPTRVPEVRARAGPYARAIDLEENVEATELPARWAQQPDGHLDVSVALAQELSQPNLTVEERAQFVKAKVDELRSFFENGVWTYAKPGPTTSSAR